jgi:hypothetical protein
MYFLSPRVYTLEKGKLYSVDGERNCSSHTKNVYVTLFLFSYFCFVFFFQKLEEIQISFFKMTERNICIVTIKEI